MLELRGVTKQYLYGARVLGAVDMQVVDGEIVAVLGAPASGKTTLLKCMAGVEACEGEVLVDGAPLGKKPDNVQLIFDDAAVFFKRSCIYNLAYPLKIRGVDKDEIKAKVETAAKELGVFACLEERADKVSLLERKRLAAARLLLRDARNILVDDIAAGLSENEGEELWAQLMPILVKKAKSGASVVYSTQSLRQAASVSDRIVIMAAGELKQTGSFDEIYAAPASVWAAQAVDPYFHFERTTAELDGERLTLNIRGEKVDVSHLKDKIPHAYLGREIVAGWHGEDFATDKEAREEVAYCVRDGGKFVHITRSGLKVAREKRMDEVCVLPIPERILLFDATNENSILI